MILSVFAYNVEPAELKALLAVMETAAQASGTAFRMELFTDNATDAAAFIRHGEGIALMLLGVDDRRRDPNLLTIRLGRLARQINRDHYVVYIIKDAAYLLKIAPYLSGATGVVTLPLRPEAAKPVFDYVLNDFSKLFGTDVQEGTYVALKARGKAHRVRVEDICFVQAINKQTEVRTMTQTIVLSDSLESLEQQLGDAFVRCHRSYLVNRTRIEYIDFKDRMIRMMDGSSVPFSRSSKDKLDKIAQNEEQNASAAQA